MNFNYTLKYRTFEGLLEDVKQDLRNFALEGRISPEQLFKIAMKINYDLGLRINVTKEKVMEITKSGMRLPEDFYVMNYALLCGEYVVEQILPQGTNIQQVPYPMYQETLPGVDPCTPITVNCRTCNSLPCCCESASCLTPNTPSCPTPVYNPDQPYGDPCIKPRVFLDCKGDAFELIQVINTQTRRYKHLYPIRFKNSQFVDCDCPNLNMMCANEAYIKDGFIYTALKSGNLYINYQGAMEDSDGNLMVPDHPMLNEYYEYALKERILENLLMEGENVGQQYQLVAAKLRMARNNALTIVNTPNFSEMAKVWALNRKAMYSKYYDMFKSHFWPVDFKTNNAV